MNVKERTKRSRVSWGFGGRSKPLKKLCPGDLGSTAMKGRPILFHNTHSDNIQLSADRRRAKRVESFCKGICFSNRPIAVNERVYIEFSEVSSSWSGVIRFGFTAHDPETINGSELPRYACPDLTNKAGYWAKALPERYCEQSNILFFYFTRNSEVMFGVNGEEKGLFLSGVSTSMPLYGLVDIYGNTTCMEFFDGHQLNNLTPVAGELTHSLNAVSLAGSGRSSPQTGSLPTLPTPGPHTVAPPILGPIPPVRHHINTHFAPMPFHHSMGRNVRLSSDRTVAVRMTDEYCNGYVFTHRPILPGEKVVVQILAIVREYVGGLTFGMTACDPTNLSTDGLPDDSDLLLDRPEYWIVNKDVCTSPEVGDEISFHLTEEGEVRYGKNGHHIASLMHVDKTLPMWAFLDMYGHTQRIKCLGVISPHHLNRSASAAGQHSNSLTVALPPPRTPGTPTTTAAVTPPPRPPPPRSSPSVVGRGSPSPARRDTSTPPSLPPKQYRPHSSSPSLTGPQPAQVASGVPAGLPPPLIPTPASPTSSPAPVTNNQPLVTPVSPPPIPAPRSSIPPNSCSQTSTTPSHGNPFRISPQTPMAMHAPTPDPTPLAQSLQHPSAASLDHDEMADNESNECKVCMFNAVDTVLYTCGHMCLCQECAEDIRTKQNLCPICRKEIVDVIKIYRS